MRTQFFPAWLRTRRFLPLFGTQFLGAFNDNLYKTAVFVLIGFCGLGEGSGVTSAQLLNIGALVFILPYFLFSALSGQLNSVFDKAKIARGVKIAEIGIMLCASFGFFLHSLTLLLLCLFLMGVHSTVFGPMKYAILPEYLQKHELITGNSVIEMGTFLAILFGQMLGTVVAGSGPWLLSALVLVVAASGYGLSRALPFAPAQSNAEIDWNIVRSTRWMLKNALAPLPLRTAILGISWFWFLGAVYTTQLPTFTQKNLGGDAQVFNFLLTLFSVGIGAGSLLCARLSHARLNLGLVSVGAVGMSVMGALLSWLTWTPIAVSGSLIGLGDFLSLPHAYPISGCILGLGFFGGFFSVPLYTWLQTASTPEFRAHAVAANNLVNGIFMVTAALLSALLLWLFDSISVLYLLVALGNLVMLFVLHRLWPAIVCDIHLLFQRP